MEQFVLGIFQEQLAKFLVGFRKEQVNANLLNGKGQIRDVNLNCSFINEQLCRLTPYIMLESIRVSKLGFNVTSWTNLKKAPILVDVEDVYVTIVEPLSYTPKEQRISIKQLSWAEFKELTKDKQSRGPYNLFDRILDNLQIEVRSINITFQPRGRFKTQREGPWTPPALHIQLRHLKYCSVDEFGNEANPDDCWRHNTFEGHPRDQTLLVYKKASLQVTIGFQKAGQMSDEIPPLMKDVQVEVQLAFYKKFIVGAILAIQVDVTVNHVEVHVDNESIPVLAHAIAGMQYCFTKDRAFDDPLLPRGSGNSTDGNGVLITPALPSGTPAGSIDEAEASDSDSDDSGDISDDSSLLDDGQSSTREEGSIDGSVENSDFDGIDNDYGKQEELTGSSVDTGDCDGEQKNEKDSGTSQAVVPPPPTSPVKMKTKKKSKAKPVILLPSGLVIYRKLSLSLSVQDCKVRGTYDKDNEGYIQLHVKGMVAEFIWPKVTREKGTYVQMSLSYISLQEMFQKKLTILLRGGAQQDADLGPIETPTIPRPEIPGDENFPLFEDRSVRPDPLDLRHSFPAQAVGMKSTVNFVDNISNPEHEEIHVLNEIGVNKFEVIFESESWCRAIRFGLNENGGGFDPRWQSGDWSDILSIDMMVHPSQPLNLLDHLQGVNQAFLDENHLISSDLVNITARLTNVSVKVPASIQRDIRSSDFVVWLDELTLVVSSALPRKFLSGKIGSAINGDGFIKDIIDFPNDPSDIGYSPDLIGDPSIRQNETDVSRRGSTFRAQLTTRGLAVRTLPVIPFFNAIATRDLLAPLEMTAICCWEGESPPLSPDSDLMKKIALVLSIQIHHIGINCDFDMIASAMSSILFHVEVVGETLAAVKRLPGFLPAASEPGAESDKRILSTIDGTKVLLKRQIELSSETAGFSFELCVEVARIGLNVWRQNVPLNSRFRSSITGDRTQIDEHPIPLIKLLSVVVQGVEVGIEVSTQRSRRRRVVKSCISQLQVNVGDFDRVCSRFLQALVDHDTASERDIDDTAGAPDNAAPCGPLESSNQELNDDMVSLLKIGGECEKDIMFRIEDQVENQRSISVAIDMDVGGTISLHIHEIEMFFLLAAEALLLPTEVKFQECPMPGVGSVHFPEGSIGALLVNVFRVRNSTDEPPTPRVDLKTIAAESSSLDQLMHTLILGVLPGNISELFVLFTVGNLLLFVPHHPSTFSSDTENAPWLGHQIREASLMSGYISSTSMTEGLVKRLCQRGKTWASLLPDQHSGFHHNIKTSQGLHSADFDNVRVVLKDALVDAFNLGVTYNPQNIDLYVGESTLSLHDLDMLKGLYFSLVAFVRRFELMRQRIECVTSALVRKHVNEEEARDVLETQILIHNDERNDVIQEAELSLQRGRRVLQQLKRVVEIHDSEMRNTIRRQQEEIDRLRVQVFLKERSRVAALALVSCQAAGWLRVGGAHMSGERSPTIASMWRYHAVLRKSLLILYAGQGKPRPLDVINLQGASLLTLAGGRRRRDVKNGFAVRERSGCTRYVLAPNGIELEVWLRELQIVVKASAGDELVEEDDIAPDMPAFAEDDLEARIRARTFSSDLDSTDGGSAHGVAGKPKRSQKIKETLSKVTASTRSGLGTAMQAAKQLGQKGSSKDEDDRESKLSLSEQFSGGSSHLLTNLEPTTTFENLNQLPNANVVTNDNLSPGNALSFSSIDTPEDDGQQASFTQVEGLQSELTGITPERQLGQRLGNLTSKTKSKFGSALQGAREKALAVAEERRRKQQERDGTDDGVARRGLRGRLENAAATVKHSIEKIDVGNPPRLGNKDRTATPPIQDPLLDPLAGHVRNDGMSITVSHPDSVATDRLVSDKGDVATEPEVETPTSGSVFRTRFSKIGSAVKTATQGSHTKKGPIITQREPNGGKSSRFSLRRSRQQGDMLPDESDIMRLKAIRVGGCLNGNEAAGEHMLSALAKIKGGWMVRVQSRDSMSTKVQLLNETGCETLTETGIAEKDLATPISESNVATEVSTSVAECERADEQNRQIECYRFCVQILSQDPLSEKKIKVLTVDRSFQEVIGVFIDVLDCIYALPEREPSKSVNEVRDAAADMNNDLANILGLSPLDIVKLTGELLGGLLSGSASFQTIAAYHEYQCEILTEFLNAALSSPMPVSGCMAVLEFLDIVDAGIMPVDFNGDDTDTPLTTQSIPRDSSDQALDRAPEIMALTASCLTYLLRAEASGILSQKLGSRQHENKKNKVPNMNRSASMPNSAPFLEPLLPASISEGLRDAIHSALKNVMTDRDDAQASLIASSVLHVHEIERERKKGELAMKKLQVAEAHLKRQQQGGLFAERFKDPRVEDSKIVQNSLEEMLKGSEEEIKALGKQLAQEVAEKTAAKLEIYRLQEITNHLRASDSAEKKALEEELRKARAALAEANEKSRANEEEVN